jgi:hypothetical protein
LFNIYIDSLIEALEKEGIFEVLAYADDLAVICSDEEELLRAMDVLDKWSMENEIMINKKKSGILIVDCQKTERKEIEGYPVKVNYKYLGIILNKAIDPRGSVILINNKLKGYLKRNDWIVKRFFTPKSLIVLSKYYQESRIIYGLNPFLDMGDVIDIAQRAALKYLRSLLGLKNNVSIKRSRVVFGLPKLEHQLLLRLVKNLSKYESHFGEFPEIYSRTLEEYQKWTGLNEDLRRVNRRDLRKIVLYKSLAETAEKEEYSLVPDLEKL